MSHQIYELMVLGMHPLISNPRRSQIRPRLGVADQRGKLTLLSCRPISVAGGQSWALMRHRVPVDKVNVRGDLRIECPYNRDRL